MAKLQPIFLYAVVGLSLPFVFFHIRAGTQKGFKRSLAIDKSRLKLYLKKEGIQECREERQCCLPSLKE